MKTMRVMSELKMGLSAMAVAAALVVAWPALADGDAQDDTAVSEVAPGDDSSGVDGNPGEEPIDGEPVGEEPVGEEPVGEDPIDEEPIDEEPVGEDPGGEEPVDDGSIDESLVDPMPVDDDGIAWAGGSPDFCEACGGEIVDEPGVEPTPLEGSVDEPEMMEDLGPIAETGVLQATGADMGPVKRGDAPQAQRSQGGGGESRGLPCVARRGANHGEACDF
jgi:hypothetical protein